MKTKQTYVRDIVLLCLTIVLGIVLFVCFRLCSDDRWLNTVVITPIMIVALIVKLVQFHLYKKEVAAEAAVKAAVEAVAKANAEAAASAANSATIDGAAQASTDSPNPIVQP